MSQDSFPSCLWLFTHDPLHHELLTLLDALPGNFRCILINARHAMQPSRNCPFCGGLMHPDGYQDASNRMSGDVRPIVGATPRRLI